MQGDVTPIEPVYTFQLGQDFQPDKICLDPLTTTKLSLDSLALGVYSGGVARHTHILTLEKYLDPLTTFQSSVERPMGMKSPCECVLLPVTE